MFATRLAFRFRMPRPSRLTPRKGPLQARSKATVAAILEATAQVLVKEGPDAATTNRIAEVAGVSVGTLYQYFPNKGAVLAALAGRHFEEMLALLNDALARDGASLEEVAHAYAEATVASLRRQPELLAILKRECLRMEVDEALREVLHRGEDLVRALLERYRGQLRVVDLDLAAFVLVRAVDAVVSSAVVERKSLLRHGALVSELVELILSYVGAKR